MTGPPDPDDSVPLSALEHVAYCERQAALIHLETVWSDNADTTRGHLSHRVPDLPGTRTRRGISAVRSLPVFSRAHGLHGVCDLVEISGDTAVPVEYKVGRHRPGGAGEVQLCGQALCLREAGFEVPTGYLYSVAERRRVAVDIDDALIARTHAAAAAFRAVMAANTLPPAWHDARCRRCSLRDDCLPEVTHSRVLADADALFRPRPLGSWS